MRVRNPFLVIDAALLFVGLLSAVPPCFGQTGDIQTILDGLDGLPFDEFIDASYKQVLLQSPEMKGATYRIAELHRCHVPHC